MMLSWIAAFCAFLYGGYHFMRWWYPSVTGTGKPLDLQTALKVFGGGAAGLLIIHLTLDFCKACN